MVQKQMMKRVMMAVVLVSGGISGAVGAEGAISTTGSISPTSISTWGTSTYGIIGYTADGAVTLNGGSTTSINNLTLGYQATYAGLLNIDGAGSWLYTAGNININGSGSGAYLTNGGELIANSLFVGGKNLADTVSVDGVGSILSFATGSVYGTYGDSIQLSHGGQLVGGVFTIGSSSYSGQVLVDGANSSWTDNGIVTLGGGAQTRIAITNGGSAILTGQVNLCSNTNDNASILVDGVGSKLSVASQSSYMGGTNSTMTMMVRNGGQLNWDYLGSDGTEKSSTITIDGTGSMMTIITRFSLNAKSNIVNISNGGILVDKGLSGWGLANFNISSGGKFTTMPNSNSVGQMAPANVSIDGVGSQWSSGNTIGILAHTATGSSTYLIQNGGTLSTSGIFVSSYSMYSSNDTDLLIVTDAGSRLTSAGSLLMVSAGAGTVKFLKGATGHVNSVALGTTSLTMGSNLLVINGAGSNLLVDGTLKMDSYTYAVMGQSGMVGIEVSDGGNINVGSLTTSPCSNLASYKTITVKTQGVMSVAQSTTFASGILTVDGNGSWLQMLGDFSSSTTYSVTPVVNVSNGGTVTVAGQTTLGGTLAISGANSVWRNTGTFNQSRTVDISAAGQLVSGIYNNVQYTMISSGGNLKADTLANTGRFWLGNGGTADAAVVSNISSNLSPYPSSIQLWSNSLLTTPALTNSSSLSLAVNSTPRLNLNGGTLTNTGTTYLCAGLGLKSGQTYTPIIGGTINNTGKIVTYGGSWDSNTMTFTVGDTLELPAGMSYYSSSTSYYSSIEFSDYVGNVLGVSWSSETSSFSASIHSLYAFDKNALVSKIKPTESIVWGWDVWSLLSANSNYRDCYLSFNYPKDIKLNQLTFWYYDGNWNAIPASELSSDENYIYWLDNSVFGSYTEFALTGAVPEPSTLGLLGVGVVGLVRRRSRR